MKSLFHIFCIHMNLLIDSQFGIFFPQIIRFFKPFTTLGIKRRKRLNFNLFFIDIFHDVIKAQLD